MRNVDNGVEEVSFAVLAAKVLRISNSQHSFLLLLRMACRNRALCICSVAWHSVWNDPGYARSGEQEGHYIHVFEKKRRTREIMASWLARWVLQLLQPKILSEFR